MKMLFIVNDLGINEPFGPMILSSCLKARGHQTNLAVIKKGDVIPKIRQFKPDILAYSMMSVDITDMERFNNELQKDFRIFSILGGPHATLNPDSINLQGIDAVCVGEGEGAILDVVNHLSSGLDMDNIPNIVTKSNRNVVLRKLIEDLDSIPFMDRSMTYSYNEMAKFGIKGIWTSRGCTFRCPYCFNHKINAIFEHKGRIVRRRSVDSVIEETKELINKYYVKFIRIQDDIFAWRADGWLEEFADRWSKEIKIPFYCMLRAEFVTEDIAGYLAKAGCFSVSMSIEAANDDIRRKMLRRNMSKEHLINARILFKKHGINVYMNSILGLPFTTIDHDVQSVDFAIKLKPEMPNFSIFMPYPGTDLGDYCKISGIFNPNEDDISHGMQNMSSLSCFTDKERKAQYNLCHLAIAAVYFPFLRNVIINRLIYLRPSKVFLIVHYFFAMYAYSRRVFKFKHTFMEYFRLLIRTIKFYIYDATKKKTTRYDVSRNEVQESIEAFNISLRRQKLEKCFLDMELKACNVFNTPELAGQYI